MNEEQLMKFRVLSSIYIEKKIGRETLNKYPGAITSHRVQNYLSLKGIRQKSLKGLSDKEIDHIAKVYSKLPDIKQKVIKPYSSGNPGPNKSKQVCNLLLTETKMVLADVRYVGNWSKSMYMLNEECTYDSISRELGILDIRKRAYNIMKNIIKKDGKISNYASKNEEIKSKVTKFANIVLFTDIKSRYDEKKYIKLVYEFIRPRISDTRWAKLEGKTNYEKLYNWLVCWADKKVKYLASFYEEERSMRDYTIG